MFCPPRGSRDYIGPKILCQTVPFVKHESKNLSLFLFVQSGCFGRGRRQNPELGRADFRVQLQVIDCGQTNIFDVFDLLRDPLAIAAESRVVADSKWVRHGTWER
jgi:hypothetical protein